MLGDFMFHNPTIVYFGEHAMDNLAPELMKYGRRVMLSYGGGSIKKNGIYDQIIEILKACGKTIIDDGGVMSNPTKVRVFEGTERARKNDIDLILAVGGGSVCDYAKSVSVWTHCKEDPWEKYFIRKEMIDHPIVPLGVVLTMVGTGSEMNPGSVITDTDTKQKVEPAYPPTAHPKFAIENPLFTYTLPKIQMVAGCFDIFNHLQEQYFSGEDDNTSDYISEGIMKSVIHSSRIALRDPTNYEARSNLMWSATMALNRIVSRGKSGDWMLHMIGQSIGAHTNAIHGMTLSAAALPYYRFIMPYGLAKFVRFATNVWAVDPAGKTDREIAEEGLQRMEDWMKELGLIMNITELGVTEEMLEDIADGMFYMGAGYKQPNREEVLQILRRSL